jgi:hypothetical protein
VDRLRKVDMVDREKMLELVRKGEAEGAAAWWKEHLSRTGDDLLKVCGGNVPINVVGLPNGGVGRHLPGQRTRTASQCWQRIVAGVPA